MYTDEQIKQMAQFISDRFSVANEKALIKIGEKIKAVEVLTPTSVYQIQSAYNYGADIQEINAILVRETGKAYEEILAMYEEVAKDGYNFATPFYDAKAVEQIPFSKNKQLQRLVATLAKETLGAVSNYSNTSVAGLVIGDKFVKFDKAYKTLIDQAIEAKFTGLDFYSQVRQTLNSIGTNGLVEYSSGVHRRIDTAVRYNVLNTSHKLNQGIQDQVGEEIGADGVEVSVHGQCAPDHVDIQGEQYTTAEFEKVQSRLGRKIGEHNCRHYVFKIVMGVKTPNYTKEELAKIKKESEDEIKIGDQTKTVYEWRQEQNRYGVLIRNDKERLSLAKAAGDTNLVSDLNALKKKHQAEYNLISEQAGLAKKRWQTTPNYRK